MRKTFLAIAALAALATPAFADAKGDEITKCVVDNAVLTYEGQKYPLTPGVDFKVVYEAPKNRYGVTWVKRIQNDPKWAFAAEVAKKCAS